MGALWGGRFEKSVGSFTQAFGASLQVDKSMYSQDIKGSLAHARMLCEKGIISKTLDGVKVLGNGELTKKLTVQATAFSASAKEKIEAAGGKAEVI